jgi:hypothetical protein
MKTQQLKILESLTTALLVVALLSFAACGSNNGDPAKGNRKSSLNSENIKPPAMDIHTEAMCCRILPSGWIRAFRPFSWRLLLPC